jgi:hypothetical protein
MIHDNKVVQDSWAIALYLEEAFPDSPSLFHGNIALHRFFYDYATKNIPLIISKFVILDVAKNCGPAETKAWFRKNREERFGTNLEIFTGETSENIAALKQVLVPIHNVLKDYIFITGNKGKTLYIFGCTNTTLVKILTLNKQLVGFADVTLASYLTMLYSLQPEMFEHAVLSTFDDQVMRSWWNRMEKYRRFDNSPPLPSLL